MRRELKPTLRAETFRRSKTVTPPDTVEEGELIINIGSSTTLHFEGSPLMDPNLVSDPNAATPVPGADANYSTQDWVAIGLATDNITNATEDVNDSGQPIIGSGGIYQPPTGAGAELTAITPSRAALFFDLADIPGDVEIIEAVLEMVPYTESQTIGDPYSQGADQSVWPNEGVQCEVVMLPEEATASATWNTLSGTMVQFDDSGTLFTLPDPAERWWRQVGGEALENPIGMPQNTRRSDLAEPSVRFLNQTIIDPTVAADIDGADLGTNDEYYGHIGYGILGGGYAADASLLRPTFNISNVDWAAHRTGSLDPISVSVIPLVEYGIANGNKANLLLRAANVGTNTAIGNPTEQLRFEDDPDILPLAFNSAFLSDAADGSVVVDIENDQELFAVTDIENATSVTYEWLIELPYVPIDGLDVTTSGDLVEGGTVTVDSIAVERGGAVSPDAGDVTTYTLTVGSATSTDAPLSIPADAAGQDVTLDAVVTNDANLDSFSTTVTLGTVAVDGDGSFTLNRVSPAGSDQFTGVVENETAEVSVTNVVGVASPRFTYEWWTGPFANSTDSGTQREVQENRNSTTSSFLAPEGDWEGGVPQFLTCKAILLEGGIPIAGSEQYISWTLQDEVVPEGPANRNGVYKVDNVAISRNCSPTNDTVIKPYDYFVSEGCSVPVIIEEPTQVGACDENSGQYGVPFGYNEKDGVLVPIQNSELDRFILEHSASNGLPSGLIGFASRGDGVIAGRRFQDGPNEDSNGCFDFSGFHMLTRNGFNGTVNVPNNNDTPGGVRPGDVAVWIPEYSESNGWIIMECTDRQPVSQLNGSPGGIVTRGKNSSDTFTQFAKNYGSHDGSSCVFDTPNQQIAWKVKVGTPNETSATAFLQNMQPITAFEGVPDFHNPQSATAGKLDDVYLIFYDKNLLESQHETVINTPITNIDASYGSGGGAGEGGILDTLGLDASSMTSQGLYDGIVLYQIQDLLQMNGPENFTGAGSQCEYVKFMDPASVNSYDITTNPELDASNGMLDFPGRNFNGIGIPALGDSTGAQAFVEVSTLGPDEIGSGAAGVCSQHPVSYGPVYGGFWQNTTASTRVWSYPSITGITTFFVRLDKTVASDQKVVIEIHRADGSLFVRREMGMNSTAQDTVVLLYENEGSNYNSWYHPSEWQDGDVISVMVVAKSVAVTEV